MGSDNGEKMVDVKSFIVIIPPLLITLGIGTALATALLTYVGDTAATKAAIAAAVANEQFYLFAALVCLGRAVAWVNFFPMTYKSALEWKGNVRSNPFILEGTDKGETVLYKETGVAGGYNRANRSLHHMVENMAVVLAALLPCGQIAPKPVFYLVAAWSAGRVMHQLGYVHGYGKHAPGFMLTTFSALALEGICALVALEGFGVPILGEYL